MVACAFNALATVTKFEPQIERINADQDGTDRAHRWAVLISINPQTLRLIFVSAADCTDTHRSERTKKRPTVLSSWSALSVEICGRFFSVCFVPLYPFRDFL